MAPQFDRIERKSQTRAFERRIESFKINAMLQTVRFYCGSLQYPFPAKEIYCLDQMDQPSSSELGEYPT